MKKRPITKRILCLLLVLCLALPLAGCGGSRFRYGVSTVEVLVSQDYSLAFRNNDPLYFYVTAAPWRASGSAPMPSTTPSRPTRWISWCRRSRRI